MSDPDRDLDPTSLRDELRQLRRHQWMNTVLLLTVLASFVIGTVAIVLLALGVLGLVAIWLGSTSLHWFGNRLAEEDRRRRDASPDA